MHYWWTQEEELALVLWKAAGCKKNYTKIPKFSKGEDSEESIISDLKVALFFGGKMSTSRSNKPQQ